MQKIILEKTEQIKKKDALLDLAASCRHDPQ